MWLGPGDREGNEGTARFLVTTESFPSPIDSTSWVGRGKGVRWEITLIQWSRQAQNQAGYPCGDRPMNLSPPRRRRGGRRVLGLHPQLSYLRAPGFLARELDTER